MDSFEIASPTHLLNMVATIRGRMMLMPPVNSNIITTSETAETTTGDYQHVAL